MGFRAYSYTSRGTVGFSGGTAGVVKRDFAQQTDYPFPTAINPSQQAGDIFQKAGDTFQAGTYWTHVFHITSFIEALIWLQLLSPLSSLQY